MRLQLDGFVVVSGDYLRQELAQLGLRTLDLPPEDESEYLYREPTKADPVYRIVVWHRGEWYRHELFKFPTIDTGEPDANAGD